MTTRFDAEAHEYFIDDRRVVNVTSVLNDLLPGYRASVFFLGRGQAVHAAAALVARGKLFEFDARIGGQVEAARRFFKEVKPEVIAVEQQVYSERYQYAGTLDLLCAIDGIPLVGDYKASLTPSTIYQCAAYALALEAGRQKINHGIGIELHADGTYKMSEMWDLKRPKQEWLSLLTTFNIRARLGHTDKEENHG
jgi:hypothetical protein